MLNVISWRSSHKVGLGCSIWAGLLCSSVTCFCKLSLVLHILRQVLQEKFSEFWWAYSAVERSASVWVEVFCPWWEWSAWQEFITILLEGCKVWSLSSLTSIPSTLSARAFRTALGNSLGAFLSASKSLAWPTCDSSWTTLLFLISMHSFSLFISASCWVTVLLRAVRAVRWNSSSALPTLMLDDLWRVDVVGYLECTSSNDSGTEGLTCWLSWVGVHLALVCVTPGMTGDTLAWGTWLGLDTVALSLAGTEAMPESDIAGDLVVSLYREARCATFWALIWGAWCWSIVGKKLGMNSLADELREESPLMPGRGCVPEGRTEA